MLLTRGMKLEEIPNMPRLDLMNKNDWMNILIQEELNIDKELLVKEHTSLMSSMTNEQRGVYDTVIKAIDSGKGGAFLLWLWRYRENVSVECIIRRN